MPLMGEIGLASPGQYAKKIEEDRLHPKVVEFFDKFARKLKLRNFGSCCGHLVYLRLFLQTQKIPFNLALSVIERHHVNDHDAMAIKGDQLTDLFHDIYYAANRLGLLGEPWYWATNVKSLNEKDNFNPEDKAAQLGSFLWAIFDPIHGKAISVLELKLSMLLLCCTNSNEELIQQHLNLLIDHNRCINQTRFRSMIVALLKFFHYLNEDIKCDSEAVSLIVENAFEKVTGLAGLSDTQFHSFWNAENRKNMEEYSYFLNIILHSGSLEMASTTVTHEGISCNGCEMTSIKGYRFKCSRCSSLDLCLLCYMKEFKNDRHNPETHKMIEIPEPGAEIKSGSLITKLLKMFYFLRSKKRSTDGDNETDRKDKAAEEDLEQTIINVQAKLEAVDNGPAQSKDKLFNVIEMLSIENRLFQRNLEEIQVTCKPDSEFHKYLEQHKNILTEQIEHLRTIWKQTEDVDESAAFVTPTPVQKFHSTPFRPNMKTINWDLPSLDESEANEAAKSKHIRGEELNKTYFEANRSTRSLQEISTWLHMRESFCREMMSFQENLENAINNKSNTKSANGSKGGLKDEAAEINSFKMLLHKVRDILEDTYSDNAQLSTVTRQLETVLDNIIGEEERKRHGTQSLRKELSNLRN